MRGKVIRIMHNFRQYRITPAHAGKRGEQPCNRNGAADHPRPCGEKPGFVVLPRRAKGSPPPMRGKAVPLSTYIIPHRITPAHAGKSCGNVAFMAASRDHPRPCGEKLICYTVTIVGYGSPPPMRGKACGSFRSFGTYRITPAHAGKSHGVMFLLVLIWDHPRPCGEKFDELLGKRTPQGSPPPMRGKARAFPLHGRQARITPAHAGKSNSYAPMPYSARDHPRPCGEKEAERSMLGNIVGSPPPMRGKAADIAPALIGSRITPAHAGKRQPTNGIYMTEEDHPRPCGEK